MASSSALVFALCGVVSNAQPTWNVSHLDAASIDYLQQHQPMELLSAAEQLVHNQKHYDAFRASVQGVLFSGVFTDCAVLQRDQLVSLYGVADTADTLVTLSMTDKSSGETSKYSTPSMANGDWKITLPTAYPNGGSFRLQVTCAGCASTTANDTIDNVTFGDVIFCAGQSNMQVALHYTFSRNYTMANVTQLNKYSNVRLFTAPAQSIAEPVYVIPKNTGHYPQYVWSVVNASNWDTVDEFSATCFYTTQMLIEQQQMSDVNFGLIDVSVGGTMVESWTLNHTIDAYCHGDPSLVACPGPACGGLYNGNVLPWVNMTIKTALWYQGENNIFEGDGGNWLNATGYACMQRLMIAQWRANFSVVAHTTPASLPFGVVQLASGTSEGHQPNMSHFRWSQSLNFALLPAFAATDSTDSFENVFLIQAHDIGDPWYAGCQDCVSDPASPYSANNSLGNGTAWFMGPIHPRPKMFVGERLARAVAKFVYGVDHIYSGPLLTGCQLNGEQELVISFNQSLMYGEQLFYQKFDAWYNESLNAMVQFQNAIQLNDVTRGWTSIADDLVRISNANGPQIVINVSSIAMANVLKYAMRGPMHLVAVT